MAAMRALAGATALACATACAPIQAPMLARLPDDARVTDPDGTAFAPAVRYRGHVAVIDFWTGWCVECKVALPQVKRLAAAFEHDGVVVLGVNAGEPSSDAARAARELAITYPIAFDDQLAFSSQLGASSLPLIVVIDRHGAIVHRTKKVDELLLAAIRQAVAAP